MAILSGNVFNVKDLSPALWLDAADSNTLFDAVSGGSLVADGGTVARWEDKSGNGRHATQSDSTRRPLRVIGAQNTRDSLRFDGINDFLTCGDTLDVLTNGVTLLCVAKFNNTGDGGLLGKSNPATSVGRYSITRASGLLQGFATFNTTGTGSGNNVNIADTSTNLRLLSFRSTRGTTSTSTLKINGRTVATSNYTGTTTSYDTTDQFFIGSYQNSTGPNTSTLWPANADICEALVFLRDLTDIELQSIERYLANKWGLGFNPLSLSPVLWLDASDSSTLFDATVGGNLVAAGGAVARWEDKSGNARHVTQATLSSRPVRVANVQGGRDVVRFDGVDDLLSTAANSPSVTGVTIYFVSKHNSFGGSNFARLLEMGSNGYIYMVNLNNAFSQQSYRGIYIAGSLLKDSANFSATTGVWRVHGISNANSSLVSQTVHRVNGAVSSGVITGDGTLTIPANVAMHIGNRSSFDRAFDGDIAEILVFPTVLTNEQNIAVERYLAQKWNIIP